MKMHTLKQSYSNCKIYHPSGKLMCVNSEKKGRWYVEKTGATVLSKNPDGSLAEIQLTFEPKGHGYDEDDLFGLSVQEARCVVSGENDISKLTKHHIVPISYRRHLPLEYKSRNHHDVVYITEDLHEHYERIADEFRNELAKKYNAMSYSDTRVHLANAMSSERVRLIKRVKGYANSLIISSQIPSDKEQLMKDTVLSFIKDNYTAISLENCLSEEFLTVLIYDIQKEIDEVLEANRIDAYKDLIDKVGDYDEFVKIWRQHFVDTMKPQFLPIGWSVDYKTKTRI